MAMKEGQTYECTNASCGCEVVVTRGAGAAGGGNNNPRCCCGMEMTPREVSSPSKEAAESRKWK
jgi:hypothetical protein